MFVAKQMLSKQDKQSNTKINGSDLKTENIS